MHHARRRRVVRTCSPKPLVPRQTVAAALSLLSWIPSVLAACSTMRKKNGSGKKKDDKVHFERFIIHDSI